MKLRIKSIPIILFLALLSPVNALACACCTNYGFYSLWTGKPDGYYLEVLEGMEFAEEAQVYMDALGFEGIKGLEPLFKVQEAKELTKFNIIDLFEANTWTFKFTAANGKTGNLRLPLPTKMVSFKVDIHDSDSGGGGPLLYKEWRFKGRVQSGDGIFKTGIVNPTSYFLVLQGRGNGCDNVEDFTNWRLEIDGRKAKYAFYGTLDSGEKRTTDEN